MLCFSPTDHEPSSALINIHQEAASVQDTYSEEEAIVAQHMAYLQGYHEKVLASDGYAFIAQVDPIRPIILAAYLTTPLSQSAIARLLNMPLSTVKHHIDTGLRYTFSRLTPDDQEAYQSATAVRKLKTDITPRHPDTSIEQEGIAYLTEMHTIVDFPQQK